MILPTPPGKSLVFQQRPIDANRGDQIHRTAKRHATDHLGPENCPRPGPPALFLAHVGFLQPVEIFLLMHFRTVLAGGNF